MDTYRVGTLLEMVREIAYCLADIGLDTRIMVQPSMGEGIFKSLPLALSGVMAILKGMDWEEDLLGKHIRFGKVTRKLEEKNMHTDIRDSVHRTHGEFLLTLSVAVIFLKRNE